MADAEKRRGRTWKERSASAIGSGQPRPWWATWPAVFGWLVVGAVCVLPASGGAWLYSQFLANNQVGLDFAVDESPAAWQRWLAIGFAAVLWIVPVLLARWSRKGWLGYFLLGICVALAVLIVGLLMWGVL